MERMLSIQKTFDCIEYSVVISYYSDKSINISLFDALGDFIECIEVYDAPDSKYDINLN